MMASSSLAGSVSYVVLHRSVCPSLERVSDDGRVRTTIAVDAGGYGMTVDQQGNYIVAAVSSLLRVTASGSVNKIAATPIGSQWLCVAVDFGGNYIVGDNRRHSIWRVSPDGTTVEIVATYLVQKNDE